MNTPNTNTLTPNPFAGVTVQASGSEPLPCGAYYATFQSVEAFSNDKIADKLRWAWTVATGPHTGRMATALTDPRMTPHTHAGRLLGGLLGRTLNPGEDVGLLWPQVQACIGKRYLVTVAAGPKGGKPSVQSVTLPPEM